MALFSHLTSGVVLASNFADSYATMQAEPIVLYTTYAVGAVLGLVLLWSLYRLYRHKSLKTWKGRLGYGLVALLSVGVVAANIALNFYVTLVDTYLTPSFADKEAIAAAEVKSKELTQEIQAEGSVLLENKNQALPLAAGTAVNVFGITSVKPTYGGAGSGSADESRNISLLQGLEDAGLKVNTQLSDFYKSQLPEETQTNIFSLNGGDYNIKEVKTSDISADQLQQAKDFSDTAILMITRNGGEGADLPKDMADYEQGDAGKHYLQLQSVEEELLDYVKANFKKVIVLVNSSNAMELGFLEDEGVSAALWIGGPGSTGMEAVGQILAGQVNPSGRLVDTYAYDLTTSPAYYNQGDFSYANIDYMKPVWGGDSVQTNYKFLNYQEGIYVGYRYYETRYVDNATGQVDQSAYQRVVQYPFGYGLSYSNFNQRILDMQEVDGQIKVTVEVENRGNVAGKDVAQVYYTAPYTVGGIEKSHVVLAGFAKTPVLEPGAKATVEISFGRDDMASYDYRNSKAYVLEQGTYQIKLMNNAHDVLDLREYQVATTQVLTQRSSDKAPVTNVFDDAAGDIQYVSRADWSGTLPTLRTADKEADDVISQALSNALIEDQADDPDIVTAQHGLRLTDMVGLSYDDAKWQQLLEQIPVDQMVRLVGFGGYATKEVPAADKPAVVDLDGPAGINGIFQNIKGIQFNSEVVVASTWNVDLSSQMGDYFAREALAHGVVGLYAPAVNIHRQPFAGRNFEYYSEDPLISGKMAASLVKSALDQGVYTYTKHFALNDQEDNREGVATWSNEQAIREIYLKAFEYPVKEGGATGIMSSFNRIGTTWAGGHKGLLQTVLRDEWGFRGMVITDYAGAPYMYADQAIRTGGDLMLSTLGVTPTEKSTDTTTGRQALRQATHNILYTVVNSKALELYVPKFKWWLVGYAAANLLLVGLLGYGLVRLSRKRDDHQPDVTDQEVTSRA